MMIRLAMVFSLILAACQTGAESTALAAQPSRPKSLAPRTAKLTSFNLTDQDGKPFSSKSLEGTPWVGSFFFTQCPAVCWRMNQILAKWQVEHPDSKIRFVSITCDPQTDTPKALKAYADHFKADPKRWTFLTGDMSYITRLAKDKFMLAVERGTHSSRTIVFDAEGKFRGAPDVTVADGERQFQQLLAEIDAESR